ncbi:MAG: sensor domain-containing diguanylate cyclase [Humidesulfovibrio sp.]|uniref:sensor domain-containing diguanylate cyclase n=1 Tax=Humidesulfovibrio sp. TaxID=2910988 RepID=UPI002732D92F|nr:sensor domain-containing diguanylate cyclase [Humidesulfovibrio sp.]MDP2847632.1 sensor domain-containing diguanylate cyclase [Humidesulfovibrio sp.]
MSKRALPRKRPVLLLVTLFLVLGFLGTTLVSYQVSRKAIRESILTQELPLTSDNVYSEILKDLVRPLFVGSMMASNTFLRDWVLEGERDKSQLMRYLSEVMVRYGAFTSFFVSDKSRNYYHPSGVVKQVNQLENRDAWYYRVRAMRDPYEINVDPDLANRDLLTIFINYRVNDFDGNFIGATGVGLTVDAVRTAISHHQERFGRRISFVDLQGRILLSADDAGQKENNIHFIEGLRELAPTILSQKTGSYEYELYGKTRLLNVRYIQELKWFLFVEKTEDSALVGIRRTLYVNLAVCFAVTILVVCITGLALTRYQRRMEEMATRDKLTGLLNRQTLDVLFQQAISLALRANEPLVVILADLDHFKAVNDKYGHMVGDQVLKLTAASLRQQLRSSDTVCRWGGEEFLMILKNCDADAGAALSEKLRAALVDDPELSALVPGGISASFGVTQLIPGECVETLVGRADTALYAAKQAGRNCVKTA